MERAVTQKLLQAHNCRRPSYILELLIAAVVDINSVTSANTNPLHVACKKNNIWAVAQLILADADVNFPIFDQCLDDSLCPLHVALSHGSAFLIKLLIDHGAIITPTRYFPLVYFTLSNSLYFDGLTKYFTTHTEPKLFCDDDFNQTFVFGKQQDTLFPIECALILASQSGDAAVVSSLLASKVKRGNYPLLGFLLPEEYLNNQFANEILDAVLSSHPNLLNETDEIGCTVIQIAIQNLSICRLITILPKLLAAGADIHARNNAGETVLHTFLRYHCDNDNNYFQDKNYEKILRVLLDNIDIYTADHTRLTPLLIAWGLNNIAALTLMILMGRLSPSVYDEQNNSIIHVFARYKFPINLKFDILTFNNRIAPFIRLADKIDQKNDEGLTPLQIAINTNNYPAVWCLIANGAKVQGCNYKNASESIINLFKCHRNIQMTIELIKNKPLFGSILSVIGSGSASYLEVALNCNPLLSYNLLLTYLCSEELNSAQKMRLIMDISDLNGPIILKEIALLAREGKFIKLSVDNTIHVLKLYLQKCSKPDDIERAKRMLNDYLSSNGLDNKYLVKKGA